jgi:uncharacterized protein YbjT (DUF2867 family)
MTNQRNVFISGATGYMGRPLAIELVKAGHAVRALARPGSEHKLPPNCTSVVGNALDAASFEQEVAADTFVHLVGVPNPSPAKAAQFRSIDLTALRASVAAAASAEVGHFVYVSVAHPAPAMKAYIAVRTECEEIIRSSGLNATILRPWYVLGPHHRWPYLLLPAYWLAERIPTMREGAQRLGLVRLDQMIGALVKAVNEPTQGINVVEVPQIRAAGGAASVAQKAQRVA